MKKIILCTGGTGGHIFPMIALYEELKENHKVKIMEQDCSLDDVVKAESVSLTSSTKGLAPVSEIINQNSNLDVSHPLFKKCQNIFNDAYFKE